MLAGKAKADYQREYMRKKRAKVRPVIVRHRFEVLAKRYGEPMEFSTEFKEG